MKYEEEPYTHYLNTAASLLSQSSVYEGLKKIGVNENVSYAAGAIVAVGSTPVAIGVAAADKGAQLAKSAWNWLMH